MGELTDKLKGKLTKAEGEVTDDKVREAQGTVTEKKGEAEGMIDSVKEKAKEKIEELKEKHGGDRGNQP